MQRKNPRPGRARGFENHRADDGETLTANVRGAQRHSRPASPVVGPELRGPGWHVIGQYSVQVIERQVVRGRQFDVIALWPGRRIDLRYSPQRFTNLSRARRAALHLAREVSGDWRLSRLPGVRGSIDGILSGPVLCLEALTCRR